MRRRTKQALASVKTAQSRQSRKATKASPMRAPDVIRVHKVTRSLHVLSSLTRDSSQRLATGTLDQVMADYLELPLSVFRRFRQQLERQFGETASMLPNGMASLAVQRGGVAQRWFDRVVAANPWDPHISMYARRLLSATKGFRAPSPWMTEDRDALNALLRASGLPTNMELPATGDWRLHTIVLALLYARSPLPPR